MIIFLKRHFLSGILTLVNTNIYAAQIKSSWLYCDDINRNYAKGFTAKDFTTSWDYARDDNSEILTPYGSFIKPISGGILIESKHIGKYSVFEANEKQMRLQEFAIVNYKFKNKIEAQKFCHAIEEKCRNDFKDYEINGAEYSAVGFGHSNSHWRGIRAEYPEGGLFCKYKFPE